MPLWYFHVQYLCELGHFYRLKMITLAFFLLFLLAISVHFMVFFYANIDFNLVLWGVFLMSVSVYIWVFYMPLSV